ncbi:MAG: HAD family hydrolase [Halobacteriovoraceae bacterium]|nr:HAD family hydrolase [Halobacteriovoraceae bacterium]MCB9095941.1 HAD family hydrolase [Halobacteriovoraceae bacterium]
MTQTKAVFWDRDGTLIVDKHYLQDPKDIEFIPDALQALKTFQEKGFLNFIVTNQSGVGRGYFPISSVLSVHDALNKLLIQSGANDIDEIVFCPHTPEDQCLCRKPRPTLVTELIKKYQLNPQECYLFGDKMSDYEAGVSAGVKAYLYNPKKTPAPEIPVIDSLTNFSAQL